MQTQFVCQNEYQNCIAALNQHKRSFTVLHFGANVLIWSQQITKQVQIQSSSVLIYTCVFITMCICFHGFMCVHRFRALIKDLEMMVQNLISSVFKTVYTVEEGVRLLDIFRPISTREVSLTNTHTHSNSIYVTY